MAGSCEFIREAEGDRAVFRLAGVLDRAAASELAERLRAEQCGEVVLDFSLVREFADLAVATLARALAEGERRPLLRGLRQHQLRIFRYFGVDLEARTSTPPAPALP
jgi:anti-anti-sigma regulatory factor